MNKVLIVGLLGVINGLTSSASAQANEGDADAAVVDGGASGEGSDAGDLAGGVVSADVASTGGIDAGQGSSDGVVGVADASASSDAGFADAGGVVGDAGDAGDAAADTSGSAEQTTAPKPPPQVREYDLVKNEGRACSVSTVGDPQSRFGVGAAWLTGLLTVVGLRRRAVRAAG